MKTLEKLLQEKDLIKKAATTSFPSPIAKSIPALTDQEKIQKIEEKIKDILLLLGLDIEDESLQDTPYRIAKMYVQEIFTGLKIENFPKMRFFEDILSTNKQMIVIQDIFAHSFCEHHFLPMMGKAAVAYIPNKKIIGLSKVSRIVQYFCKRPQLQERLTAQIADSLSTILNTKDVAVFTKLHHLCVNIRGPVDKNSNSSVSYFKGRFQQEKALKEEFFSHISKK